MAINENELAAELISAIDTGDKISENRMEREKMERENQKVRSLSQPLRPAPMPPLTPTGIAKVVAAATDEDAERASRTMLEQMEILIDNLEKDIAAEDKVRMTIVRRIDNLNLTRQACFAAKEVLKGRDDNDLGN